MQLPKDVYFRVVNIAESYYVLLHRLKEMENSVLNGTARKDGQPRGSGISNTTATRAEKIIEKQAECERKVRAIERAWHILGPLYQEFIRMNFFEHQDARELDFPMSLEEKKEVRAFFLIKLAQNLNEI
ncbi:hypothetical protein CAFE_20800 [Caprobacter fermentans]|uniref:Uncharacterized protein n=1 Tax=Caproicibacter fermentans TaxID=2576756 RepID=A0A6N8I0K1_9FIRM|nr:hypothetical protein [Caproicibacter fermentans]MVB11365.1 hypothetical protein [Caproicibacter fermentans]